MIIRKAKMKDAEAIWNIRNHPENRIYCNNVEEIPLEKHIEWFKQKYFLDKNNYCFVLKNSTVIIGYCRFDKKDNKYVVSIALLPKYQMKGFGSFLLSSTLKKLHKKIFLAEIKKNNFGSQKIFFRNNFIVYNEDKYNFYLQKNAIK